VEKVEKISTESVPVFIQESVSIVVDVAGKVSDSKCVRLVRKWLEVVPVLAVMVVQFLQQRQIRSLGKTL
jgi:hypothetical protein